MGIRCKFYVLTDKQVEDEYDQEICNTRRFTFSETLALESLVKVLLDYTFVDNGMQGFTLRVMDAIGIGKKIISNNRTLIDSLVWSGRNISIVYSSDDIDLSLI